MDSAERAGRFNVTLDACIPLERLVLNRLKALTGRSRQVWLRSLVVQGFLLECRTLQLTRELPVPIAPTASDTRRSMPPSAPYTLSPASRFTGNNDAIPPEAELKVETTASAAVGTKPLAHLRRVIG